MNANTDQILTTDNKQLAMKKLFFLLTAALFIFGCKDNQSSNTMDQKDSGKTYSFTEKPYGNFEGKDITEYTITNPSGMQVSIINYGGTVTKLIAPDKSGKMANVILGYDSLAGYLQKENPYFNALIGRYGNRIAAGKFTLDSKTYTLAGNNNGNSLHGGNKGYDKVVWTAKKTFRQ